MPSLDYAILCQAAMEHDGMVSVLGAGLSGLVVPQMPAQITMTFTCRIEWDDSELGSPHVLRLQVLHDDGEQLADIQASVSPVRQPGMDPQRAVGQLFTVTPPLLIRRPGAYRYELTVDGDVLRYLPLDVNQLLPNV